MQEILITGINGFVGRHLAQELVAQGWNVIGLGHGPEPAPKVDKFISKYIDCDLTNQKAVSKLPLNEVQAVINLAGMAAVGQSFDEPDLYMKVNVGVLTTLCERIKQLGRKDLRILAISTGAVYAPNQSMPLTENSLVSSASSPYAASKVAMEAVGQSFRAEGYDCVIARPFNHIGPGQAQGFLLPDLYEKIRSVKGSKIRVGNLQTQRDYTDVRDIARAYMALATKDRLEHAIYNVCSGKPVPGTTLFEKLKIACNRIDLRTVEDENLFRPSDSPILYGDNSRIYRETGWQPTIPLEQTIRDFVAAASA